MLAALENDLGWDARTADVIVGTSAGSVMGAMLRADIPVVTSPRWLVGVDLDDDAVHSLEAVNIRSSIRVSILSIPFACRAGTYAGEFAVWVICYPFHTDPMPRSHAPRRRNSLGLLPELDIIGDDWPGRPFYCTAVKMPRRQANGLRHDESS